MVLDNTTRTDQNYTVSKTLLFPRIRRSQQTLARRSLLTKSHSTESVIQRMIVHTDSSVLLFIGTFPGLLNYRGCQVVLFDVFSLLEQVWVAILHMRYP